MAGADATLSALLAPLSPASTAPEVLEEKFDRPRSSKGAGNRVRWRDESLQGLEETQHFHDNCCEQAEDEGPPGPTPCSPSADASHRQVSRDPSSPIPAEFGTPLLG
jgi:hypothetical protein